MANIIDKINEIRQAIFGKDVRESIAAGIETINTEVESTTARQAAVEERQDDVENTFQEIINMGNNPSAEVTQARGTAPNLGTRLDGVDSQLAERAQISINVFSAPFANLQTALNYCADNNITANIPAGTYEFGDITLKNRLHIKGNGQEKTILNYTGSGDFLKYDGTLYTGSKLFTVEDLTLVGTNKVGKAIAMNDSTGRQRIKNVSIRGFAYGIYAPTNCFYGTLENVKIEGNDIGLHMDGNCFFWNVVDCQISNNRINLNAKNLVNNTFDNTDLSNATDVSINLNGAIRDLLFKNCWLEKNAEFVRHTNVVDTKGVNFEKCYISTQAFVPTNPYIFNFENGDNINVKDCYFDNDVADLNEIFNILSTSVGIVNIENPMFKNNNKVNLVKYPSGYLKERVRLTSYNASIGAMEQEIPTLSRQYNENLLPNSRLLDNASGWTKTGTSITQITDTDYGNATQIVGTASSYVFRTIDKSIINKLNLANKPTYAVLRLRYKSLSSNTAGAFVRIRFYDGVTNDDKVYNIINDDAWHDVVIVKHTSLVNTSCTVGVYNMTGTFLISDMGLSINGNIPSNMCKNITEEGGEVYNNLTFALNAGVIVRTPDGTKKYRIGIDNSGNLTTTLV